MNMTLHKMMLGHDEKKELLDIARQAIEQYLKERRIPSIGTVSPSLSEPGAAFVTLEKNGALRGCVGHIIAHEPLYMSVRNMALKAAFEDHRFTPLSKDELPKISFEISVLGPLIPVKCPDDIKIGRDGLYVKQGRASGLLLPQVASEHGWSSEEFLGETCCKAGLPVDAWKDATINIYRFEADVFGEERRPSVEEY